MRMVQATLVAAIAAAVQFAPPKLLPAQEVGRPALMIEIDGAIGPATSRYVKEALTTAGEQRADVVILRLNTPGGLSTSIYFFFKKKKAIAVGALLRLGSKQPTLRASILLEVR